MNKKIISLMIVPILVALVGCASTPKSDKIIGSSERDHKSKKAPKWTRVSEKIKGGHIYVTGAIDVGGDSSPQSCYIGSDSRAMGNLVGKISARLERQLQSASENYQIESQTLRDNIARSTKVDLVTGLTIDDRYYEKIWVRSGPVQGVRYTCYSLAKLPLDEFKRLVNEAIEGQLKRKLLSDDFQERVNRQCGLRPVNWRDFLLS